MRQVQLLQADLTKRNALINTKEQQILQKTKLQKEKDQQIELALKHLETERSKFDHQKSAEISQIRDEQKSLENRQSELDKQAYKLEVQFKQLQSLKKITSADKDKFNQQLAELNRKRIQIEKRVAEVEYNRSIMLSKLRSLEGQLQLKKQQIEIDELRLKKVGNEQSNTLKEIELSLANLNQQKSEFDQTKSKELEKINSRYKEIEKSESLLNKKIYDFKANAAKLEERSQAIDVNQFKLQKQYDQFYRLKRAIVREQQKLEASKVETQKHLNKFNDELNSKRDALKSLYVKVKAVEKEQNQRKDELEKIAKDREAEMAKLETTKKEIADKFDQFKVEKENEIRRLSQIHQNLDNREKTLNKIGNKLKQEHQLIKSKSEKTQEELEQLQADKTRLIKENEILSSQQKSQFHSNHHSENHMCNYQNNNNCQNHFSSCNPCSRNNQPTYNYQQQDYGQFAQAVIPFNAYQPNPNLVPTNPLVAMQQMINQQQMQMMQQNHHWELRQLSKERNELAEKLEAIKRFRKEEKERFFMEQIRRHENEYYRRKYRHDHHDQRALVTVSQEKQRNDHAVSDMLKRLAKITTVR